MKLTKILVIVLLALVAFYFLLTLGNNSEAPEVPTEEQNATEVTDTVLQIEDMAMAADGKEFIAAPPTVVYDDIFRRVRKKQMDVWIAERKQKEQDGLTAFEEEAKIYAAQEE